MNEAKWSVRAGDGEMEFSAPDEETAIEIASNWIRKGDWDYGYVRMTVTDPSGEEIDLTVLVGEPEPEPICPSGEEHDWQSPEELGGCKGNPGVWSRGGTQIVSREVCVTCRMYRDYVSESTPGQLPRTPETYTYIDR